MPTLWCREYAVVRPEYPATPAGITCAGDDFTVSPCRPETGTDAVLVDKDVESWDEFVDFG
ncbi:hypothetical protein AB0L57_00860 [Nocardia sp. NPDC052254]|uniref:hypothetical protein n=1 Tax=Nocardia sp. NPDC052254 TaxID=3155681 RepID=UPI00343AE8C9